MRFFVILMISWFLAAVQVRAQILDVPLTVEAPNQQSQVAHIRLHLRPLFTYVPNNEAYSDFTTQIALLRDAASGDVLGVIRQTDANFADHIVYLPRQYLRDGARFELILSAYSPWGDVPEGQAPAEVVSTSPIGDVGRVQSYEIVFGKPDDTPFLGDNVSYAEGAYQMAGSWFFNKFFRYGDNPFSIAPPIVRGAEGYLRFNFYLSAESVFSLNGERLAVLERSLGNRFHQDIYRTPFTFSASDPASIEAETATPFRKTPPNLRQMAFALNSIEMSIYEPSGAEIDLRLALNTRLDYRHDMPMLDALAVPRANASDVLLQHQGAAWLPSRAPTLSGADFERQVDAIVLLDPMLEQIVRAAHSTGDVWINSAVGAALMLEELGYSTAYAFPEDVTRLNPKVIYVPSQPFYNEILSAEGINALLATGASVIVEPSFAESFIGSAEFHAAFGFRFIPSARFVRRDDVRLRDGEGVEGFAVTSVFEHAAPDGAFEVDSTLIGAGLPLSFTRKLRDADVMILTIPAAYHYFNYAQQSQRAVVEDFVARTAAPPAVRATSRSQVRAYAVDVQRCSASIVIENNNFGMFDYYGFTRAARVRPSDTPPIAGDIVLSGAMFSEGRSWRVVPRNTGPAVAFDAEGRLHVRALAEDALIMLVDRNC